MEPFLLLNISPDDDEMPGAPAFAHFAKGWNPDYMRSQNHAAGSRNENLRPTLIHSQSRRFVSVERDHIGRRRFRSSAIKGRWTMRRRLRPSASRQKGQKDTEDQPRELIPWDCAVENRLDFRCELSHLGFGQQTGRS